MFASWRVAAYASLGRTTRCGNFTSTTSRLYPNWNGSIRQRYSLGIVVAILRVHTCYCRLQNRILAAESRRRNFSGHGITAISIRHRSSFADPEVTGSVPKPVLLTASHHRSTPRSRPMPISPSGNSIPPISHRKCVLVGRRPVCASVRRCTEARDLAG